MTISSTSPTLHTIQLALILGWMTLLRSGKKRKKNFNVKGSVRLTLRWRSRMPVMWVRGKQILYILLIHIIRRFLILLLCVTYCIIHNLEMSCLMALQEQVWQVWQPKHVVIEVRCIRLKLQMSGKQCFIQHLNGELGMQFVATFRRTPQICLSVIIHLLMSKYYRKRWIG